MIGMKYKVFPAQQLSPWYPGYPASRIRSDTIALSCLVCKIPLLARALGLKAKRATIGYLVYNIMSCVHDINIIRIYVIVVKQISAMLYLFNTLNKWLMPMPWLIL